MSSFFYWPTHKKGKWANRKSSYDSCANFSLSFTTSSLFFSLMKKREREKLYERKEKLVPVTIPSCGSF